MLKKKILIADDSEFNREILITMLGDEYDIVTACDGEEAVLALQKCGVEIDLVLLDIVMPKMDGFEVLDEMRKNLWIEDIPVIMITALNSRTFIHRAFELGVSDYVCRPFDSAEVLKRVSNMLKMHEKQQTLIDIVAEQISEKERNSSLMIAILSHIVEFHNGESGLHVLHINAITKILLQRLMEKSEKYQLPYSDTALISMASALHDIGKISIPDEVLNKPGRLTPEEFEIMKTHSANGAAILKSLPFQDEPLLKYAYDICRWHHERYDGKGYPDGLVGDEIPIWAQVVSVADVYDALTSERVYKKAFSHEKAMEMILGGECGTFNPLLLECLKECEPAIIAALKEGTAQTTLGGAVDVKNFIGEYSRHKELSPHEKAFAMLERERVKNEFMLNLTEEMYFEYYCDTQILNLSVKAAELLGMEEATFKPMESQRISELVSQNGIGAFMELIISAPQNMPVVTRTFDIKGVGTLKVDARAVYQMGGSSPMYVIGKIQKMGD